MGTIPSYTFQPGVPLDVPGVAEFPASYAAQGPGVFAIGPYLYAVLNSLIGSSIEVVRSADGGQTWTELDTAHHPTDPNLSSLAVFFEGSTIWVAYVNANNSAADFIIQKFSLITNLWVAPVASTVSTNTVLAIFVRSDATIAVINEPVCDGVISGLQISVLDLSANWTNYDLGADAVSVAGMTPPPNGNQLNAVISTGFDGSTIYCFFNPFGAAPPYFNACFYQSFSIANSLVTFFEFPNTTVNSHPDLRTPNGSPMGQPVISGSTIYLPVARSSYGPAANYPSLYISLDSGVTWTAMPLQESTDPEVQGDSIHSDSVIFAGQALLVQGQLWIVYSQEIPFPGPFDPIQNFIRLCVLPIGMDPINPLNWTASTLQSLSDYTDASVDGATFSWPTISIVQNPPNVLLFGELYNGSVSLAYWFGDFFPSIGNLLLQPGPVIDLPYCIGPSTRSFF